MARQIIKNRVVRAKPRLPEQSTPIPCAESILLTGGIGDVFAIESYFSEDQRRNLKTILYATHKHPFLTELFSALPNYPRLSEQKVVWGDFRDFWCFCNKQEVEERLKDQMVPELACAEDWSIIPKFMVFKEGHVSYTYSSFVKHQLCELKEFRLPSKFVVIQPYSTDKRIDTRDFNSQDWQATTHWLRNNGLKGVVINKGEDTIPESPEFLNLSNQTTVVEAVEILKRGCGYIGVDSWLSVLAAKMFGNDFLAVKSTNWHCYEWKHIYFAPKTAFDFLSANLLKALKFKKE